MFVAYSLLQLDFLPVSLKQNRLPIKTIGEACRQQALFLTLFLRLGETWKKLNEKSVYVIDSYPIAVCDNYRIRCSKIYHGEGFRGYIASKKRYFYGLRIRILVTEQGEPVEFFLEPGAFSDTSALGRYNFDIPEHSFVTGDKSYNDYTIKDIMREAGIELLPL